MGIDKIHKDIGGELKGLALIIEIFGTIGSLVAGIVLICNDSVWLGVLVSIGGEFVTWVTALPIYAFGQLVQNSDKTLKIRNENQINNQEFCNRFLVAMEKIAKIKPEQKSARQQLETKIEQEKETIKLSVQVIDKIAKIISELKDDEKAELQQNYQIWYEEIKKLTVEEILERINNATNWQDEYITLCYIELESRI